VTLPETDGPEYADLGGALVDAAHHGDKDDQGTDEDHHAGHGIGEALELVQCLETPLHHLLNGRHPGVRQFFGNLGDHVADGTAGAEGRHLGEGDFALLAEQLLGFGERGEDQGIIL